MIRPTTILTALLLFFGLHSFSQCMIPPPPDPCTGSETLLTDNEILSSGATKWYYGPDITMNQLTMRGGKLIVCGNLTINKFYMDSGTIVIRPGARFTDGGGIGSSLVFNGNSSVINYGTFQVYRNLVLDMGYVSAAKPNVIINATTSSVMSIPFAYFVINNAYSYFVNNGQADFSGIITDPGAGTGSICLGNGSQTLTNILINKKYNAYTATAGSACIRVNQFSQFYDSLTTSPNINACLSTSHYSDSSCRPFGCKPNAWGAANLFKSCGSCATISILALQLSNYNASIQNGMTMLNWKTNTNADDYTFNIERSTDGSNFYVIDSFAATPKQQSYTWYDKTVLSGVLFYRIKNINTVTGAGNTSIVLTISKPFTGKTVHIYPNPVKNELTVYTSKEKEIKSVSVFTTIGKKVYEYIITVPANTIKTVWPSFLPAGIYIVKTNTTAGIYTNKIMKE